MKQIKLRRLIIAGIVIVVSTFTVLMLFLLNPDVIECYQHIEGESKQSLLSIGSDVLANLTSNNERNLTIHTSRDCIEGVDEPRYVSYTRFDIGSCKDRLYKTAIFVKKNYYFASTYEVVECTDTFQQKNQGESSFGVQVKKYIGFMGLLLKTSQYSK